MSLRNLQKQAGVAPSQASQQTKDALQPQSRARGSGRGGGRGYGGGGGDGGRGGGGGGYYGSNGTGDDAGGSVHQQGGAVGSSSTGMFGAPGGATKVMAPAMGNRFNGSDAQRRHVEEMRKAVQAPVNTAPVTQVAVGSHLGLSNLQAKKQKEEDERQAKRDAARAKRLNQETKKEQEDSQALEECEAQAREDSQNNEAVKYEAALIVRIANRFGTAGVWIKIAEAIARGAEIPLEPKRIYLLAHPDKCRLEEASDATAILNAQRPPEMWAVPAKTKVAAPAVAATPPEELTPEERARQERFEKRRKEREERERSSAGGATTEGAAPAVQQETRRDPEDGHPCTFQDLEAKYKSLYSPQEIQLYWDNDCQRAGEGTDADTAASRQTVAPVSAPFTLGPASTPASAPAPTPAAEPAPVAGVPVAGKNPRTKRY